MAMSTNRPARQFWNQGFGVIRIGRMWCVPFLEEATAQRIADQASSNGHGQSKVFRVRDAWVYMMLEEE